MGLYGSVALLTACGSAKPVLTNYHEGVFTHSAATHVPVDVTVNPRPLTSAKEEEKVTKTFADWPDSVKHIYLKAMVARTKTPEDLVKALQIPLVAQEKKAQPPRSSKFDEYKLVFEFSNIKKYFEFDEYAHPGTRLEFLNTTLKINETSYAYFYTIDKLQNEFDELDMGSLDRTQTVSFNSKLSIDGGLGYGGSQKQTDNTSETSTSGKNNTTGTFDDTGNQTAAKGRTTGTESTRNGSTETNTSAEAKVSANAEASYANEQAIKEAVAVKLTRMKLGFALTDKQLTVSQRARVNGDISENVFVTANLKFKNIADSPNMVSNAVVYYFDNLFDKTNQPTHASDLTYNKRTVTYVNTKAPDIKFTSNFSGEIRAVGNTTGKSGNNIMEFDDDVHLFTFNGTDKTFILDRNEYVKSAYRIKATYKGVDVYLNIASPIDMNFVLFSDDEPTLFLQWLLESISGAKPEQLNATKFRLYLKDVPGKIKVDIVSPNMKTSLNDLRFIDNLQLEEILPPAPRKPTD